MAFSFLPLTRAFNPVCPPLQIFLSWLIHTPCCHTQTIITTLRDRRENKPGQEELIRSAASGYRARDAVVVIRIYKRSKEPPWTPAWSFDGQGMTRQGRAEPPTPGFWARNRNRIQERAQGDKARQAGSAMENWPERGGIEIWSCPFHTRPLCAFLVGGGWTAPVEPLLQACRTVQIPIHWEGRGRTHKKKRRIIANTPHPF